MNGSTEQLSRTQRKTREALETNLARGAVFPLGGLLSPLRIESGKADPFLSAFAFARRHHLRLRTQAFSTAQYTR